MSAPEEEKTTTQNSASQRPAPADIATILQETRNLVQFHERLGIDYYPTTPELRLFQEKEVSQRADQPRPGIRQPFPKYPSQTRTPTKPAKPQPPRERDIEPLQEEIRSCDLCSPATKPRKILTGRGNQMARLMIVGDCPLPGAHEDIDQIFGPQEDEMLWKMMVAIGETPDSVYVTNCVKCCTAGQNADHNAGQNCLPFLEREIAIITPTVICAMGEKAARLLLDSREPLHRLRGVFHPRRSRLTGEISYVMPTFHPRFLLRNPPMKRVTWVDLQAIQKRLAKK